jgi:succinylarginine dihydrolase
VPANLTTMFHRAIEAESTTAALRAIFADPRHFVVHDPLPGGGHFSDEGAANHTRLVVGEGKAVHLFAWGRRAWGGGPAPERFPARQTLESSAALARLVRVAPERAILPQQHPVGIDGGAFHTDVLAVGHGSFLMVHELAFLDLHGLLAQLREKLGDGFSVAIARDSELPVADAVAAYPFNSQVLTLPSGGMVIVAPEDSRENTAARRFLERVIAEPNPVESVHYLDVRQSMDNGGGPACLRLRVTLSDAEVAAVKANVFFTPGLGARLETWASKHYRDRLAAADLADPALWREVMTALDELTQILALPKLYAFQQ